ncbi:centrosomal protein of 152 kDa-like, partial [Saccoglossus kowalevskii]
EVTHRLEETVSSEEQLNELNLELKKQMAEMVSEYDDDRRVALERCQNACLQLHEDSSRKMRSDLHEEFENERRLVEESHQQQLMQLKSELNEALKTVDDIKQLYINVCEEKNRLDGKHSEEVKLSEDQLTKLKEAMLVEKDEALEKLKQSLADSHRVEMMSAKEKWQKDQEPETDRLIETK